MKRSHLISAILVLFVVYATRLDIYIDKLFSANITAEYVEVEQAENDADEKENEEGKDDDSKEYSSSHNRLTTSIFQLQLKAIATRWKLASPAIDLEFPPPKS